LKQKKEHEARIAEEQKKRLLAAQQKDLEAETTPILHPAPEPISSHARQEPADVMEPRTSEDKQISKIPGAFVDSPERPPMSNQQDSMNNIQKAIKSRGLFSQISRSLGLDKNGDQQRNPFGEQMANGSRPQAGQPLLGNGAGRPGSEDGPGVTSPQALESNLRNAVGASKSWDSKTVFSQPQTNEVVEQNSYCDSKSDLLDTLF